jgi:23S rRNA (cytidine1920-2'-O)/16S rRNA (cytidine1409-2'-O)-methyltransferase
LARNKQRLGVLERELARVHPELDDPRDAILRGEVLVDGIARTNPASLVPRGASITLRKRGSLRGRAKLAFALATFGVEARGRTGLDLGAAAGGFTLALLDAGARRVYAVDAGHGQLLGSLRLDPRVVNLEATNIASLDRSVIPEAIDVAVFDLSYLALRDAVPQLARIELADGAESIALVKPHFELHRGELPTSRRDFDAAVRSAGEGFTCSGWRVVATAASPVQGARGAFELLMHARRGR